LISILKADGLRVVPGHNVRFFVLAQKNAGRGLNLNQRSFCFSLGNCISHGCPHAVGVKAALWRATCIFFWWALHAPVFFSLAHRTPVFFLFPRRSKTVFFCRNPFHFHSQKCISYIASFGSSPLGGRLALVGPVSTITKYHKLISRQ
jgi:hypothetical protein